MFVINKPSNGKMFNFPFWQSFSIINWQENENAKAKQFIYYAVCMLRVDILLRFILARTLSRSLSLQHSRSIHKQSNVPFNRVVWFLFDSVSSIPHSSSAKFRATSCLMPPSSSSLSSSLPTNLIPLGARSAIPIFPVLHATCECIKIIPHHQQSWKQ